MKFSFKPSPNYRSEQTTSSIMLDVTMCLCAILVFSIVWHGVNFGMQYALRVVLMAVFAVVSALLTEVAYFGFSGSKNVLKDVSHSYGWVTALILVLITKIDVSYYAVVIATVIAVVFGKLVFGGFGQNIFNPAAFGEAIIMNSFASSTASNVTDVVLSGATPMAQLGSSGWGADAAAISSTLAHHGGLLNILFGNYTSTIGGSCALLVILCGIYLIWRGAVDWRLSCTYVVTIVVVSLVVGLAHGTGLDFVILNVLPGGVLFGAFFMLTDPVTTPVSNAGKVLFAVCTACLTLILRWKANLPDGVLFSILLMNMLTPAIDKLCDGSQIKDYNKIVKNVYIVSAIAVVIAVLVGVTLKPASSSASVTSDRSVAVVETVEGGLYGQEF